MGDIDRKIGGCDMAGDLAKVVGLDDGKPLLLAVTPKEHCRDLAIGRVGLGLPNPFLWLDLLAALYLDVKWKIGANHIPATALWIASVLLCAPRFLPTLLAQVRCKLPLPCRTLPS